MAREQGGQRYGVTPRLSILRVSRPNGMPAADFAIG